MQGPFRGTYTSNERVDPYTEAEECVRPDCDAYDLTVHF